MQNGMYTRRIQGYVGSIGNEGVQNQMEASTQASEVLACKRKMGANVDP